MADNEEMWVKIQTKTFTRWCNDYLSQRNLKIENLRTDLSDGFLLHQLLEILSTETILPKPRVNAKMKIQKIENLNTSLKFIKDKQIKLQNIGAEDVHDQNLKLILGLIWTLILRFQIAGGEDEDPGGLKSALLEWVNRQIVPQGLRVYDFKSSWSDGRAFCGLVNALQPGLMNLPDCTDPKKNMDDSFQHSLTNFRIPKILDAEDVINHPDDLSIMTYVAYFRAYQNMNTAYAPNCTAEGPGLYNAVGFQPAYFTVTCRSEENEEAIKGGANVNCRLLDNKGKVVCPVIVRDLGTGKYDCEYTSPIGSPPEGFELQIMIKNQHIKDSSFHPVVIPGEPHPGSCEAHGPGISQAKAGEKAEFTIVAKDQLGNKLPKGGASFSASLKSPKGTIPVTIVDNNDGTYAASYVPETSGPCTLNVDCQTKQFGVGSIKNAPFTVNVSAGEIDYENWDINWGALGPDGAVVVAGEERKFQIKAKDRFGNPVTLGGCKVSGKLTPTGGQDHHPAVKVVDLGNGAYEISHVVEKVGPYKIELFAGPQNKAIGDSKVKCIPAEACGKNSVASGEGISKAKIGEPNHFKIQARDRFDNDITVGGAKVDGTLKAPNGQNVPIVVKDNNDGTYSCTYPDIKLQGAHILEPKLNGSLIKNAPFTVGAEPGEVDLDNFDIDWGQLGPDGQVVVAGEKKKVTCRARDKNGNYVRLGGVKIAGKLSGETQPPVTVVDNKDGSYDITYTIEKAGPYHLNLMAGPNNKPIGDCKVKCIPAEACGKNSVASGDGIHKAKIGEPNHFKIQARDKFNNDIKVGGANIDGHVKAPNGKLVPIVAKDNKDGTYTCTYPDITLDGIHSLEPKLNGDLIKDAPFKLAIEPGEADLDNLEINWGDLAHPNATVVAGEEKKFNIRAKDKFGNYCKLGGVNIAGSLSPQESSNNHKPKLHVKDNGNGQYDLSFVIEKTGPYKINLTAGPNNRPVGESKVTCIPAEACGKNSVASGPGISAATVGAPNTFVIQARDKFDNDIKVGGAKIDGHVKSPTGKLVPVKAKDNNDGTYLCSYPDIAENGIHSLEPTLNKDLIKNAPFKLTVDPKPMAYYNGPRPFQAVANRQSKIPLDVINLSPSDLDVKLFDKNKKPIPHKIVDNGNGTFDVVFTPTVAGPAECNLTVGKDALPAIPINVQETPSAKLVGPNKRTAYATKPFTFKMETVNVKPEDLKVDVKDPNGAPFKGPVKIHDNHDGTMDVTFIPPVPGMMKVNVTADGEPLIGGPLMVDVLDKPTATYSGPRPFQATANRESKIPLDLVNLNPEDLDVKIMDPRTKRPIPHKIVDNKNGTCDLVFTPTTPGQLVCQITADGENIPEIPIDVAVTPGAKYLGPAKIQGQVNQPVSMSLDAINIKPDDLDVTVRDEKGNPVPHKLRDNGDGTFTLDFVPTKPGQHKIDGKVKADNSPIEGFPVTADILAEPWARVRGVPPSHCKVGDTVAVQLESRNLKPSDLSVVVPSNKLQAPPKVQDNGDGTFTVSFIPTVVGELPCNILIDGKPIQGCPLKIHVDKRTIFGADLLNLLDDIAAEYDKFTLVPYTDLSEAVPNAPVLFNVVPDSGFTPVSTSTAFEATCWLKSDPKKTIPCLIRETPDQRIEVRFVPTSRDTYVLDVKQSDHSIKQSPQDVPLSALALSDNLPTQSNMKVAVQVEEKSSVVNVPFKFTIIFADVPDPKLITAKVTDPTGKVLPIEYAPQYSSGSIEVLLTPQNAGTHKINMFYEGVVISGTSPFQTNPEPFASIIGESVRNDAYPGDEYLVKMAAVNCKIADFKFALKGPGSHGAQTATVVASLGLDPSKDQGIGVVFQKDSTPVLPNGTENGTWDIKFMTKFSGEYNLLVFHNGKPIKGCPVQINSKIENSQAIGGGAQKVTLCSDVAQDTAVIATSPRVQTNGPVQISATSPSKPSGGGPVVISAKPVQITAQKAVSIQAQPVETEEASAPKKHSSRSDKERSDKTHRSKSSGDKKSSKSSSRDKK